MLAEGFLFWCVEYSRKHAQIRTRHVAAEASNSAFQQCIEQLWEQDVSALRRYWP